MRKNIQDRPSIDYVMYEPEFREIGGKRELGPCFVYVWPAETKHDVTSVQASPQLAHRTATRSTHTSSYSVHILEVVFLAIAMPYSGAEGRNFRRFTWAEGLSHSDLLQTKMPYVTMLTHVGVG